MYMSGNRQQRQWIIMAAKELGIMPTTEGGLDCKLDMTHAMDGYPGVEHALPIAPMYDDVVELFKASQTTNSPTLLVSYGGPFGENYYYTHENVLGRQEARDASRPRISSTSGPGAAACAGRRPGQGGWFARERVRLPAARRVHEERWSRAAPGSASGSHGQLQGLGYHWEMWAMASGGMSTHDVLRVATIFGAEAIGMDKDIGSLEAGKMADIVVLDKNPLDDIRNTNTISVRDEERPALRRQHAGRGLAARASARDAALGEHGAGRE